MNDKLNLRAWSDIEVPRELHPSYRVWMVLRAMDTSNGGYHEKPSEVIHLVADVLGVSNEHVRVALKKGEGIFWTTTSKRIYLVGYQRVYAGFDRVPVPSPATEVPVERVGGHIANFRKMLAALKVHRIQGGAPGVEMGRDKIAAILGVGRSTLREIIAGGWIERIQQIEEIGLVKERRMGSLVIEAGGEAGGNRRRIAMPDGSYMLVEQHWNVYRSCFTKQPWYETRRIMGYAPVLHKVETAVKGWQPYGLFERYGGVKTSVPAWFGA